MDKLDSFRNIIQEIVTRHSKYVPHHGQINPIPICDVANDNYLLLDVGWDNTGRVHSVAFHMQIRDEKIWVEWDGTDTIITQELMDAGVSKEDIVLGFYRPERRAIAGFATA